MKKYIYKYSLIVLIVICLFCTTLSIYKYTYKAATSEVVPEPIKEIQEPVKGVSEELKVREEITIEVNTTLPEIKEYFDNLPDVENVEFENSKIKYFINNEEVNISASSINKYQVIITYDNKDYSSILNIVDTTKPVVSTKTVTIYEKEKYSASDFISSYDDNSKSSKYTINYKNISDESLKSKGKYTIPLIVCDESNNCLEINASLVINQKTTTPPKKEEKPIVEKKTETVKEYSKVIKYNYGVKKVTYQNVTYEIIGNNKKEISRSNSITEMDHSGFNGTVSTMSAEAKGVSNKITTTKNTILNKTNEYRAEAGVEPLTIDDNLNVIANIKAMEMAYSNKFDHTRPNGKEWSTLHYQYYTLNKITIPNKIGENLALNYASDIGACEGWKHSKDHYRNIIDPEFTKVGIGKYTFNDKTYWVQVFSS